MTTNFVEDFTDDNIPSNGVFKFPNVGDTIKGTFVERVEMPPKGVYGAQYRYEFANCDINGEKQEDNIFVYLPVTKKFVHDKLRKMRRGQRFGIKRVADYVDPANKTNNPAKSYVPYLWGMDEAFLKVDEVTEIFGGEEVSSMPF